MPRARPSDDDTREDSRHSELEELAAFGAGLEELRRQSQLSYRSLSAKADYSSSVLAKAASGRERPTLEVVRAFVSACGGDLPVWIDRWHTMNAAVDRYQRELQAMVDAPYEIMASPSSPGRFNRQLQLRVCRTGKQAAVTLRANYAPSTASGVFNGTRLASEEFVHRMLAAANAPDDEQATWLEWRRQLAREPRLAEVPVESAAPTDRSRLLRRVRVLLSAIVAAAFAGSAVMSAWGYGSPKNVHPDAPPRSHPVDVPVRPNASAPSGVADHDDNRSLGVPHTNGKPNAVKSSVDTVPTLPRATSAVAPDGVRRWKATIVVQTPIGDAQIAVGGPLLFNPGDTVYVVCITTKTEPKGWYYTDQGEYLNPAHIEFSGNDRNSVPACTQVPFPEIGMAPAAYEPAYSRATSKRHPEKG